MNVPFLSMTGIIAVSAFATGCASAGGGTVAEAAPQGQISGSVVRVENPEPSVLVFPKATVDDVWKLLPATFAGMRVPGGVMNEGNRVFGNPKVVVSTVAGQSTKELFRCASESGLSLSDYRIEFGIAVQPRPAAGGGVELDVQITALGRLVSPSRTGTTNCVTNGGIEQKLRKQLQAELVRIGKG